MERHERGVIVALLIACISLAYLIVMLLALLDIYQGREPNLSEEWAVVASGWLLVFASSVLTIVALYRVLRQSRAVSN